MSAAENRFTLAELGAAAAKNVREEHFPAVFDPPTPD